MDEVDWTARIMAPSCGRRPALPSLEVGLSVAAGMSDGSVIHAFS